MVNSTTEHPENEEANPLPGAPAAPPRDVTRQVRRRAWGERRVRLWWLLGLAALGITLYYALTRIYFWSDESSLIKRGVQVSAEVVAGGGNAIPKNMKRPLPPDTVVDMEFLYKDKKYEIRGPLAGRTETIITRTPIPIFIDPSDPAGHWTARTTPGSLVQELLPALLVAPLVVILFTLALYSHGRVLRIYRQGQSVEAEVMRVGHSAAAPLSRMIDCAAQFGDDDRVVKILLPARKAPQVGESLWLLALPNRPEQAIPVALFE